MSYSKISLDEAAIQGMAVASHAANRPDAVAARDQIGQSITWNELNARANQLARVFRAHGLEPDDCVGGPGTELPPGDGHQYRWWHGGLCTT